MQEFWSNFAEPKIQIRKKFEEVSHVEVDGLQIILYGTEELKLCASKASAENVGLHTIIIGSETEYIDFSSKWEAFSKFLNSTHFSPHTLLLLADGYDLLFNENVQVKL